MTISGSFREVTSQSSAAAFTRCASRFRLYSSRAIRGLSLNSWNVASAPRHRGAIKHLSRFNAHFSYVLQQVRRILINSIGTRLNQFRFAVSAGEQANSQSF